MNSSKRSGLSLFELVVILALLGLLLALLLPAVARVRSAANRTRSANNLKQIGLAVHAYYETHGSLAPGNDDRNFSTVAKILPYIEQEALYRTIDFNKPLDDEKNRLAAKMVMAVFLSPNDPLPSVTDDTGATNYLFCAGSRYALENNNGLFYQNSTVKFPQVTDGLSNTSMTGETLKGEGGAKAVDMQRQHVQLKKDALGELNEDSGVKDFADDKNSAGNRCAAWIDGRFLQGKFTGTRSMNDKKPDVNCDGLGGLSALRSLTPVVNVGLADGSVRARAENMDLNVWKAMATRNGGEAFP